MIRFDIQGKTYNFYHDSHYIYFDSKMFFLIPRIKYRYDKNNAIIGKCLEFNWNGDSLFIDNDGRIFYPTIKSPTTFVLDENSIGSMAELKLIDKGPMMNIPTIPPIVEPVVEPETQAGFVKTPLFWVIVGLGIGWLLVVNRD